MLRALLFGGAALIASGGAGIAQDIDEGGEIFRDYCAACHGSDGRGSGAMAESLAVPPPDLTSLSASNNGVFPIVRVVRQIDGRDPALTHGGVMPLFGAFFEGQDVAMRAETGQPMMTSQPIADLTAYLQSIQQ